MQYGKCRSSPLLLSSEEVNVVYSSTLNLEAVRSSEIYVLSSILHCVTSRKIILFREIIIKKLKFHEVDIFISDKTYGMKQNDHQKESSPLRYDIRLDFTGGISPVEKAPTWGRMVPVEQYNDSSQDSPNKVTPDVIYVQGVLPVMVSKQILRLILCQVLACRHDL